MAGFASLLCAVDGSRASAVAVRRAIALATPDTELAFLSVVWRVGAGPTQRASLGVARAEEALAAACARAADAALSCERLLAHSPDPPRPSSGTRPATTCSSSAGPFASRAGGMLSGSVASFAAHQAPGPVLLARGADEDVRFPQRIVVASDGSSEAELALDAVADLACGRFVTVTLAYVDGHAMDERLAEEAEGMHERLGFAPAVVTLTGTPHWKRRSRPSRASPTPTSSSPAAAACAACARSPARASARRTRHAVLRADRPAAGRAREHPGARARRARPGAAPAGVVAVKPPAPR